MSGRQQELREFCEYLRSQDPEVDETFAALVERSLQTLEFTDAQFGDAIRVSRPTVNRWRNGVTLPHPVVRKALFIWLEQQAAARLKSRRERRQRTTPSDLSDSAKVALAAKGR